MGEWYSEYTCMHLTIILCEKFHLHNTIMKHNFYTVSIIFSPKKNMQLQNNKYIYMYKNLG